MSNRRMTWRWLRTGRLSIMFRWLDVGRVQVFREEQWPSKAD